MSNLDQYSDVSILARTAFGENRGGGTVGMQSVLNVIMNRAAKPSWWGHTPREVCLKPYQFSCWLTNDPNYVLISTVTEGNPTFGLALDLAASALKGELEDITNGATYYVSEYLKKLPHWADGHEPCATVAHQLFFNDVE